jgi:hypothetical protein
MGRGYTPGGDVDIGDRVEAGDLLAQLALAERHAQVI